MLLAAPQVESVYQQLRGKLGLPLLPTYKTVVVQPDDRPLSFDFPSGELRQPSPHLLNLPDTISHENALFRSLIFYQINELVRESFDRYGYGRAWMWSNLTESALRNWLQMESGVVEETGNFSSLGFWAAKRQRGASPQGWLKNVNSWKPWACRCCSSPVSQTFRTLSPGICRRWAFRLPGHHL